MYCPLAEQRLGQSILYVHVLELVFKFAEFVT